MNVALIPVRGGSKSIPLKNIKEIAGKPLVYWTAKAANDCKSIDKVFIATDSIEIKEVVEEFGLQKVCVIGRSDDTASDTASTETVMIEFSSQYEYDNIVLIQATSPLLTSEDIERGFRIFAEKNTDSVLSVVRQKRFHWKMDENGMAIPTNYDYLSRPRRQEFEGYMVENGAFYITSREAFEISRSRISGNIRICEMDEMTYFEIDEPSDWIIIEELLKRRNRTVEGKYSLHNMKVPKIKMFLTDCDGCLTDGGMYYTENGDEVKKFNTLDGMGFKMLKERGILTGIITGEKRELNYRRAKKLGVDIYEEGIQDKLRVVKELCNKYNIDVKNVAYVGDDINDLEVVKTVGFGCSVANGMDEVKSVAAYVSNVNGGSGAVREIINKIIRYN